MTSRRPLFGLAPLAAAVALVAAGCGGGGGVDRNDYVKELNEAVATLQNSTASLGPGTGAAAATRLADGSKAMDAAAADFAAIAPPSDAEHAHGQIVDGLHKLAGTFRVAADAARSKDDEKLLETLQGFDDSTGARKLQAATDELAAKGYKVN
jgi:hypothetical protein